MSLHSMMANILTPGLKKIKGMHSGETCYIFGDGPSVKWFDLNYFNDHPAICCGVIPLHKDFSKLDVRYGMMVEPRFFCPDWIKRHQYLRDYKPLAQRYREVIKSHQEIDFFVNLTNKFSISGNNVNYVFRGIPHDKSATGKLLNQDNLRMDLFEGSFHASLTMAYYLGFTKIHLVGFDGWVIHPSKPAGHWYEYGDQVKSNNVLIVDLAADFIDIIGKNCEVSTIGVNGDSKNVKYIEYESFTGQAPTYRENHELLDQNTMRLLQLSLIIICGLERVYEKFTEENVG